MIPSDVQRRVAHLDVIGGMVFPMSVSYWHDGDTRFRWIERPSQTEPVLIGGDDALSIDADSDATISAPDGGIVHVNGDLNAGLKIGGHHEAIICGDVPKGSTIEASGFHHVYVGGSVHGTIVASGSSKIWIDGDFTGSLAPGSPSTHLSILGDFAGSVSPTERAPLLWITVGGYASHESVSAIAAIGCTQFNATIGRSDVPAGLYPQGSGRRRTERGNSFSRWCVLTQGDATSSIGSKSYG